MFLRRAASSLVSTASSSTTTPLRRSSEVLLGTATTTTNGVAARRRVHAVRASTNDSTVLLGSIGRARAFVFCDDDDDDAFDRADPRSIDIFQSDED